MSRTKCRRFGSVQRRAGVAGSGPDLVGRLCWVGTMDDMNENEMISPSPQAPDSGGASPLRRRGVIVLVVLSVVAAAVLSLGFVVGSAGTGDVAAGDVDNDGRAAEDGGDRDETAGRGGPTTTADDDDKAGGDDADGDDSTASAGATEDDSSDGPDDGSGDGSAVTTVAGTASPTKPSGSTPSKPTPAPAPAPTTTAPKPAPTTTAPPPPPTTEAATPPNQTNIRLVSCTRTGPDTRKVTYQFTVTGGTGGWFPMGASRSGSTVTATIVRTGDGAIFVDVHPWRSPQEESVMVYFSDGSVLAIPPDAC